MNISIIVAIAHHNAIGKNNGLLTYIPADLKRFKQLTTGHPIIMGRKTFESLPKGALPNRRNIVMTHQKDFNAQACEVVHSVEEALHLCQKEEEVFVIGGSAIYNQFLPITTKLYITWIHQSFSQADTFFPALDLNDWEETSRRDIADDEKAACPYSFADYTRKTTP